MLELFRPNLRKIHKFFAASDHGHHKTLLPGCPQGVYFIGFGNGFPKPHGKDTEKCLRWVESCGRKYFTIKNVTKDTYMCSLHFVGGNGPTDEYPDPIKCGTQVRKQTITFVRRLVSYVT